MRFIAIARVSCASLLMEPYDIAPVLNRFTMLSTGSTSSMGTGVAGLNSSRPLSVQALTDWSLMRLAYSW